MEGPEELVVVLDKHVHTHILANGASNSRKYGGHDRDQPRTASYEYTNSRTLRIKLWNPPGDNHLQLLEKVQSSERQRIDFTTEGIQNLERSTRSSGLGAVICGLCASLVQAEVFLTAGAPSPNPTSNPTSNPNPVILRRFIR